MIAGALAGVAVQRTVKHPAEAEAVVELGAVNIMDGGGQTRMKEGEVTVGEVVEEGTAPP